MSSVLVTGVNGFVGHHVAAQLHQHAVSVFGVSNQPEMQADLIGVVDEYLSCDLTSPEAVSKIDLSEVDAVINLAGFAKVGESHGQGKLYNRVNVGVHEVLYNECLSQKVNPRIIAVSTGAVYDPNQAMPITEESTLVADSRTNEYVVSKKLAEAAVLKFNEQGLHCVIARPFNHTGPGQLPGFLLPDLYEQIKSVRRSGKPLQVGNLDTRRDFTDVRDVARAYIDLALAPSLNHVVYNICSGVSIPGSHVLELLAQACGIQNLETEIDSRKIRPNEVLEIYGSNERLSTDTGWSPAISFEETVSDFVASQSD